jgi:hypothetical protein
VGGNGHSRLKDERDWLLARVAAATDLPLQDIRRELATRNVHAGYGTMWRFFAKEKISFRKNRLRCRAGSAWPSRPSGCAGGWRRLDERIDTDIKRLADEDSACERLTTVNGIGSAEIKLGRGLAVSHAMESHHPKGIDNTA